MGTTMAFYHIQNRGSERDCLQAGLSRYTGTKEVVPSIEEMLKSFVGEEMFRQAMEETQKTQQFFDSIFGERPKLPSPMVAYRPDAPWLPFFDEDICEGRSSVSSKDARRLSKVFGAPVLVFSIFDSDILFVSYSDAAQGVEYNYARSSIGMEEYDTELFQAEFPQFLVDLCSDASEEKMREIWDADEVFEDDRMYKLGEILGLSPINMEVPEGFEVFTADQPQKKGR